jgi:hypothetical protein
MTHHTPTCHRGRVHRSARALVLVEGASDRAALLALAARQGRDLEDELVEVVNLGGATNIGRFLEDLVAEGRRPRLAGMYDAPEERYFRRGLERAGHGVVPDRARLEDLGFFACEPDLEGELIRALGTTVVEAVIEEQGELTSWHILQRQPAQLARSVEDQLHRFLGTRSGRKETYARLLVEALDPDRIPAPLQSVLRQV